MCITIRGEENIEEIWLENTFVDKNITLFLQTTEDGLSF